jgi:hypothetical protein
MTENLELVQKLFIENKDFVRVANLIYKFLSNKLIAFSDKHIRSLTTLLVNFELAKYPNSSEEGLILRINQYVERISSNISAFANIKDNFELWMTLLVIATSGSNPNQRDAQEESAKQENCDTDLNKIILESGIYQIERIIWKNSDPALAKVIINEINNDLLTDHNLNLHDLINHIEPYQKHILGIVKNINKMLAIKGFNTKNNQQQNRLFINQNLDILRQLIGNNFNHCFAKFQLNLNTNKFIQKLKNNLKNIEHRRRQNNKRNSKLKKYFNRKKKSELAFSLFYSHLPTENVKIPNYLAANLELKREAKRLIGLGMSRAEGCDSAAVKVPGKFQSLCTRTAKTDSIKI